MKGRTVALAVVAITAAAAPFAQGADLQAGTLAAWNAYVQEADARMQDRADGRRPFLWMDESAERAARVRRGEAVIAPVLNHGTGPVPHGLLHDWIGAIFIPGATLDSLSAVVHDFDNFQHIYRPVVASSRVLACTETTQEFQMVWQRKLLMVNAAMQATYHAYDVTLDDKRGYSVADSVEVREIEHIGQPGERLLPRDTGNGFLWRIRSMARFQERDGGVYLEIEAIALTRDVPASLAWVVNPLVNHLSVNSLTATLRQTRDAVVAATGTPRTLASCAAPVRAVAVAKPRGAR